MLAAAVLVVFSVIAIVFVKTIAWDIIVPLLREIRNFQWSKEKIFIAKVNWPLVIIITIFFFNLLIIYIIGDNTLISIKGLLSVYIIIAIPLSLLVFVIKKRLSVPPGPMLLMNCVIVAPFVLSLLLIINYIMVTDVKIEKYQIQQVYLEKGIGRFTPSKKLVVLKGNALREFKSFRMFESYEKIPGSYLQFHFEIGCLGYMVLKERQILED